MVHTREWLSGGKDEDDKIFESPDSEEQRDGVNMIKGNMLSQVVSGENMDTMQS